MKKNLLGSITLLLLSTTAYSQLQSPSRLGVFIDCSNTWCDMQYIRSEINVVDFLYDNATSDVHILMTSQGTGSGGSEYLLLFFGQQYFKNQTDTIRFTTAPVATDFEIRELVLKYMKAGLVPFLTQTSAFKYIEINLKPDPVSIVDADSLGQSDPWNDWVMRVNAGGYFNADANYNTKSYNGNISANKITDRTKFGFGISASNNKSTFDFNTVDASESFVVKNHNWSINHYLIKTISPHWSWSYEAKYEQNTFSNIQSRALLLAAVEYNIFPYTDVNTKLFTMSYGLTARKNTYYNTTIYNKDTETLYGHRATAYLSLNQKWGNSYAGISYHNYFHDWSLFNLGLDLYSSVRVAGGLSFYIFAFGGLTRDQVSLVKGNATPEEVLARRRQLASGYTYYTSMGINYRFGSKLNNVVNPRFDRSSSFNLE